MDGIEWKDGAVCFAYGGKMVAVGESLRDSKDYTASYGVVLEASDFQLNEIRRGDYIEASELDTEQKYNDAVEAFGLFGFIPSIAVKNYKSATTRSLTCVAGELWRGKVSEMQKRKITYPQLMAIGKLKRAMIDRDATLIDDVENTSILSSALNSNASESPNSSNWSDEHYNHFYQLTKDDIESGEVKVDAYFVNRMWKINSWEDTGAGFHILKTFPRIANNKNSLKRELVALKKQIDMLCKLHGVDDDTN